MSLPQTSGVNGATPATDEKVIDAELADWVYHRADADQGLGLDEIESGASIYVTDPFKTSLTTQGYTFGKGDNFIYNKATGFCCAVVQDGYGYAIVVRGTDVGSVSLGTAIRVLTGFPSASRGAADELDSYQDIVQGRGTLAPTQSEDLLKSDNCLPSAHKMQHLEQHNFDAQDAIRSVARS